MTLAKLSDVETHLWDEKNGFMLFVKAANPRCATAEWFAEHRQEIRDALDRYGVAYFRGFPADSVRLEAMIDELAGDAIPYLGGVSPRSHVHGTVFTASDAPPDLNVVQHHEMSYHNYSPHYICFYCDSPATEGGATPVSDGRRFGRTLEAAARWVIDDLEKKGTLFVRNYNEANFKSWSVTWQTTDRAELEARLREARADFEWITDDWLRTKQKVPAIIRDPLSGARVVYSSINLWHRWYVKFMNKSTGFPLPDDPEKQPFATFFGDGSEIPEEFIEFMHKTHREQMVTIPWQKTDFMIIQNFLTSHGRQAYVPPRRILVTMREKTYMTDPVFSQPQLEERLHG